MLQHLIKMDLVCSFSNMYVALQIYVTLPVSNALLKRVKNYLRSVLAQEKLSYLSILAIENEIMNKLNIDTILDKFSA